MVFLSKVLINIAFMRDICKLYTHQILSLEKWNEKGRPNSINHCFESQDVLLVSMETTLDARAYAGDIKT